MVASAVVGSAVVGGLASKSAADKQADAAEDAADAALNAGKSAALLQRPYHESGVTALDDIASMDDYFNRQFSADDLKKGLAPNYDFRLAQGNRAISNALNAKGGTGGNFATGLVDYNQNTAQDAYQQAFQNFQGERGDIFSRLYKISGLGQNAASGQGNAIMDSASAANEYNVGGANATAAGYTGISNAITGGVQAYQGLKT